MNFTRRFFLPFLTLPLLTFFALLSLSLSASQIAYQRLKDLEAAQLPWRSKLKSFCCYANLKNPHATLCAAAREGNLAGITSALARGAKVAAITNWNSKNNAICIAWEHDHLDAVKLLLCKAQPMPGSLPTNVIYQNQAELLAWLLEKQLLYIDQTYETPLKYCCKHKIDTACTGAIHCEDCPHETKENRPLISYAIEDTKLSCLQMLLNYKPELFTIYDFKRQKVTPLKHALIIYFDAQVEKKPDALRIIYEIATKNSKENDEDMINEDILAYALSQNASEQFVLNLCACMRHNDKNFVMPTPQELVQKLRDEENREENFLSHRCTKNDQWAICKAYNKNYIRTVKLLILKQFAFSYKIAVEAILNNQNDFFAWLLEKKPGVRSCRSDQTIYYCCKHEVSETCEDKIHCFDCPHPFTETRPLISYCIEKAQLSTLKTLLKFAGTLATTYQYNRVDHSPFTHALARYYNRGGCNCVVAATEAVLKEIMIACTFCDAPIIQEDTLVTASEKGESQEFIDHLLLCSKVPETGFKTPWITDRYQYLQNKRKALIASVIHDLCKQNHLKVYDLSGASKTVVDNIIAQYL